MVDADFNLRYLGNVTLQNNFLVSFYYLYHSQPDVT